MLFAFSLKSEQKMPKNSPIEIENKGMNKRPRLKKVSTVHILRRISIKIMLMGNMKKARLSLENSLPKRRLNLETLATSDRFTLLTFALYEFSVIRKPLSLILIRF